MPHEEKREMMLREYHVGEFRGSYPQIETDPSVDVTLLTGGDDEPFYVTMPIARIGETSGNGLVYDEALVEAIENQVVGQGGIMGHIKDRQSEFPPDAVDWVGVKRVGETLWAKAYVPPGDARKTILRRRARGGKLATSIYGPFEEREALEDGRWRARGLTLESLDLAPPERAALRVGDGSFEITAEMENENENEGDDDMPTREEIIAELTANDLPSTVRESVIQEWQKENQHEGRVAELEQERDDAQTLVETLQGQLEELKVREFDATLDNVVAELVDWKVNGEDAEGKVNAFRRTVRSRILSELKDERDPEKVEEIAAEVWEEMKPLAETLRAALSGPAAIVGGKVNGRKLEDTPEERQKARSQMAL